MKKHNYYLIAKGVDFEKISEKIANKYQLVKTESRTIKENVYDTFDWRLHKNNILLRRTNYVYSLITLLSEEKIAESTKPLKADYKFWWDFPDSQIKNVLKAYLDVRALLVHLHLKKNVDYYRVLNKDDKTVVYLQMETIKVDKPGKKSGFSVVGIHALKGYEKEFFAVASMLKDYVEKELSLSDLYALFHKMANNHPGKYSSKFNLKLSNSYSTQKATQEILKHLLQIMKQNEQGIIEDIDTEFLHDFRVSIRRTRSALSQIKNVFPDEDVNRYKSDFALIGRTTNRLRDLDVYILKKEKYKSMLPGYIADDIDPLFSDLKRERNRELKKVAKVLQQDDYQKTIANWEKFLNAKVHTLQTDQIKNAKTPVKKAARKFISKKYMAVKKIGLSISDETPDEHIHALRIECKKLRYLIEFFQSLFETDKVGVFIKYLKKLQDNLGDLNDYYVQQLDLQSYLENKVSKKSESLKLAVAIGALISALNSQQLKVRSEFSKTFSEFVSKKNEKVFKELFM